MLLRPKSFFCMLFIGLFIPMIAFAATFGADTTYHVCFTPGENCTAMITRAINLAQKTILVQAYSFTSAPIARALVEAKNRGVSVKIILDKSQFVPNHYSESTYFLRQGIPLWDDNQVAIAHNKVMIIDNETVITGSFNFTKAAQFHNAENLLIIHSHQLAMAFSQNWQSRLSYSEAINSQRIEYRYSKPTEHWQQSDVWTQLLKWLQNKILKTLG